MTAQPRTVVASFWQRRELSRTSGTPVEWLRPFGPLVEVHCVCHPEVAAARSRPIDATELAARSIGALQRDR